MFDFLYSDETVFWGEFGELVDVLNESSSLLI